MKKKAGCRLLMVNNRQQMERMRVSVDLASHYLLPKPTEFGIRVPWGQSANYTGMLEKLPRVFIMSAHYTLLTNIIPIRLLKAS